MKYNRGLVSHIPIIDFILSVISSWWAIVLLNTDMFSRQPDTYGFFENIATENQWAILFIVAAAVKIIGIVINNSLLRKTGLIMSAFIYGLIAYAYMIGIGWFSVGFGTFFAMSIMALWGIREVKYTNG